MDTMNGLRPRHRVRRLTAGVIFLTFAVLLTSVCPPPTKGQSQPAGQHVKFAGARSSSYGIRPFPSPEGWTNALRTMAGYFPCSIPVGIWIVGRLNGSSRGMTLEFPHPDDAVDYGPLCTFSETDKHEPFLNQFDANGIKVFLQIEPGFADVETAMNLVLNRYKHHPSVIGFGIDVEWFKNAKTDGPNAVVTDALAKAWEARVKSQNPKYRLFVKHFRKEDLPPTYRGDMVFVDDSQEFRSIESFLAEYKDFADLFFPNTVMFQVGYRADKTWWSNVAVPIPKTLGEKLAAQTRQECGIVWVDFTLRDVLPAIYRAGGRIQARRDRGWTKTSWMISIRYPSGAPSKSGLRSILPLLFSLKPLRSVAQLRDPAG